MSAGTVLMGVQEPTFAVFPEVDDARTAEEAIELAEAAGIELQPWQEEQVIRILGQRSDQEWAATRCGLAVARQNGKGVILEVVVLAKTILLGERVLWTAHEVRTMQESFARFRAILDATPSFSALVKTVRASNGQEKVLFTNGAEVKFSARSKSAARGLGFRTIVFDEAQELEYLTLGAIVPTLSGQGTARTQLILMGTPPYSRKGEVFTDTRAAAYEGGDDRLAWSEWSLSEDDREDDRQVWARTNPALGTVVREEKIVDEFAALKAKPEVFRRERLGEWGKTGNAALAIDQSRWAEGAVGESAWPDREELFTLQHGDVRVIAVDCTFNAEMTTLTEAVPLANGQVGLRVVDAGEGLSWITGTLSRIREETANVLVTFDPARTGDLTMDLADAGIRNAERRRRVLPVSSRDLSLACDGLVRQVREGNVLHSDPRLDAAAENATRSTFDDGKGWKLVAINGADISPLIAGALAIRALREHAPKSTGRKQRLL